MSTEVWNRAAASYADVLDGQFTQMINPILGAAGVSAGSRVLDVGTGPGSIAAAAEDCGASAVGVDYAPGMVEAARQRFPGTTFEVADAADLPFADGEFDAVVMGLTLFLLPDPPKSLSEALRVLRPGGTFAATVWDGPTPGHAAFGSALQRHAASANPFAGVPLLGVNDHAVLAGTLETAGFSMVRVERLPVVWRLESPDSLFEAFSPMYDLTSLSPGALDAFRQDVVNNVAAFKVDGGYDVPFPALLLSGKKP